MADGRSLIKAAITPAEQRARVRALAMRDAAKSSWSQMMSALWPNRDRSQDGGDLAILACFVLIAIGMFAGHVQLFQGKEA